MAPGYRRSSNPFSLHTDTTIRRCTTYVRSNAHQIELYTTHRGIHLVDGPSLKGNNNNTTNKTSPKKVASNKGLIFPPFFPLNKGLSWKKLSLKNPDLKLWCEWGQKNLTCFLNNCSMLWRYWVAKNVGQHWPCRLATSGETQVKIGPLLSLSLHFPPPFLLI